MNNRLAIFMACLAGLLLGAIFFGGLWWTVRKAVSSPQPALWFFGSLLIRMSIALAGFYWAGRGHWQRLIACLFGFIIARLLVLWFTRSGKAPPMPTLKAAHAP